MRLFFGIPIEDGDRPAIRGAYESMMGEYDGHYTFPYNLHITLAFIGEADEKLSYMLSQIGDKAFNDFEAFSTYARRVESFKEGRINYLRVDRSKEILRLYERLTALLDGENIAYSKALEYTPHITIRRGAKCSLSTDTASYNIDVKRICLFESTRDEEGIRYIPIKTWLGKEGNR